MNLNLSTEVLEENEIDVSDGTTFASKVILFNDEIHTFDDVILQLMKAINCTPERGEELAWVVHSKGKAVVYEGDMPDCLRVSGILEEIALHTQIEY